MAELTETKAKVSLLKKEVVKVAPHPTKWRNLQGKDFAAHEILCREGNLILVKNSSPTGGRPWYCCGYIFINDIGVEQCNDITTVTDDKQQVDEVIMRKHFAEDCERQKAKDLRKLREAETYCLSEILREKNYKIINEARSQVFHLQQELRELFDKSETLAGITSNARAKVLMTSLAQLRMLIEHSKNS